MHNCSYLHADHAHRARAPPTPQPVAKLLLYAGLRLCALIPASLCLRVPTGAFLPCFVTGAALGRALGQPTLTLTLTLTLTGTLTRPLSLILTLTLP